MICAGRGFGKSRAGSEFIREEVREGRATRIALVGRTAADVREVMVDGNSGILNISPPSERPLWQPTRRRLVWMRNKEVRAIAMTYSSDEPNVLRGPEHDLAWGDEIAAWRYSSSYDNLMMGLRVGNDPRVIFTTTPRPTSLIRGLVEESKRPESVVKVVWGTTYENARNLPESFMREIIRQYKGTRLGMQELEARILDDNPGALWTYGLIEATRALPASVPPLDRIVVAIDPAKSSTEEASETGIVVAGVALGKNPESYVLEDATIRGTPYQWAKRAILMAEKWKADRIVAEKNVGGEMVEHTLQTVGRDLLEKKIIKMPAVGYKGVDATRGKQTRAEPISALYEQNKVHHVGVFDELETQMTEWTPGRPSPDRMDALVWALTELMIATNTRSKRFYSW